MLSHTAAFAAQQLLLLDSLGGAGAGAGAALDAEILVDLVTVSALNDSLGGAGVSASAAGNASVGDNVHAMYLLLDFACIVT